MDIVDEERYSEKFNNTGSIEVSSDRYNKRPGV
jgi:hypothetical protein